MEFRVARRKENRMPRLSCDERFSKAAGVSASVMSPSLCAFTFRCESVAFQPAARFVISTTCARSLPALRVRLPFETNDHCETRFGWVTLLRSQPWRLELEGSTFLDG